ncbi:Serine/threonine-protein kinase WARTS-like protein [Frankliniella fusca]|uniref:Serine/threonine-protein kinase WARTS-like protein n=1 Tax=Frankliniella fusca TaxID=407009 RepID=A0AAE1LUJ3_9NEOP|nr:Serine/threonine-protein kinase WARTS-like protein [Frankliniella fusca]
MQPSPPPTPHPAGYRPPVCYIFLCINRHPHCSPLFSSPPPPGPGGTPAWAEGRGRGGRSLEEPSAADIEAHSSLF